MACQHCVTQMSGSQCPFCNLVCRQDQLQPIVAESPNGCGQVLCQDVAEGGYEYRFCRRPPGDNEFCSAHGGNPVRGDYPSGPSETAAGAQPAHVNQSDAQLIALVMREADPEDIVMSEATKKALLRRFKRRNPGADPAAFLARLTDSKTAYCELLAAGNAMDDL